jgi:hypothetical protein
MQWETVEEAVVLPEVFLGPTRKIVEIALRTAGGINHLQFN